MHCENANKSLKRLRRGIVEYGWRAPIIQFLRYCEGGGPFCAWRRLRLFLSCRATIGRHVRIGHDVSVTPGAKLLIGDDVWIGDRCTFEVSTAPGAMLEIGNGTWISHDTHIQASSPMKLGSDVLIGEFTSIRDTSHIYHIQTKPIRIAGDRYGSVAIEDNVWIGRGCCVLANGQHVVLSKGSVIGANTVISRSTEGDIVLFPSYGYRIQSRFPSKPKTADS